MTFTFLVAADATEIVVGLALRGDGSARANQLRVSVEPFDVNRPVPPEVETLLNAAIKIVRTEAPGWTDAPSPDFVRPDRMSAPVPDADRSAASIRR